MAQIDQPPAEDLQIGPLDLRAPLSTPRPSNTIHHRGTTPWDCPNRICYQVFGKSGRTAAGEREGPQARSVL